jgi:hypothetical protein
LQEVQLSGPLQVAHVLLHPIQVLSLTNSCSEHSRQNQSPEDLSKCYPVGHCIGAQELLSTYIPSTHLLQEIGELQARQLTGHVTHFLAIRSNAMPSAQVQSPFFKLVPLRQLVHELGAISQVAQFNPQAWQTGPNAVLSTY